MPVATLEHANITVTRAGQSIDVTQYGKIPVANGNSVSYDRYWEGRKLWGSFVNNSRNLALKLNAFLPADAQAERDLFRTLIHNFIHASKEQLRKGVDPHKLHVAGPYDGDYYAKVSHVPNQILKALFVEVTRLHRSGVISGEQLIVLNAELQSFADNLGACERIKRTPIPYSYSIFIKKVIFLYIITMPVAFGLTIGYWAVPIVMFMFYAFASLELISEEIEDPFGGDTNDLPTQKITENIKKHVGELL